MKRLLVLVSLLFVIMVGLISAAVFEADTHAYKIAHITGVRYHQIAKR